MDRPAVSISDLVRAFLKIGLLSFGGPAGQISLMHQIIVDEKKWLDEQQFLRALNFCMLLPGPEAMQLAIYAGWHVKGMFGGLVAGLLFIIPGAFVVFGLSALYAFYGTTELLNAAFYGVKCAVLVIVFQALTKISKRALTSRYHWVIASAAFLAIFVFSVPFPILIAFAALVGFAFSEQNSTHNTLPTCSKTGGLQRFKQTMGTIFFGSAIWFAPLGIVFILMPSPLLAELGLFFSKLAIVTFGGAYSVLAYMVQDVVSEHQWLTTGEMLDGLGLAETTPGPLILVTQFVGFLAAFKEGGFWLAIAGMLLTLWMTFVPCFIWIFTGAPYLEELTRHPRLSGALSAVTAAVVGVILNLSIWFGLHVIFSEIVTCRLGPASTIIPIFQSIDATALALSILAGALLMGKRLGMIPVLLINSLAGLLLTYLL